MDFKKEKVFTMRLTDELVEKFDKAGTIEERKAILSQANLELTDDEIEMVSGGTGDSEIAYMECAVCGWKFPYFKRIKDDFVYATEMFQRHCRYNCSSFGPR